MLTDLPPPEAILAMIVVIFFGIGLHEYAHCKFADMAGDPTPRMYGRVTLNLTKHFEPLGTIMMILSSLGGVGIGWGRPAPVNPSKMRNPKWDHFAAVAAGPISNLVQAVIYAFAYRLLLRAGGTDSVFVVYLLTFGVLANIGLFLFNLIPLGPLDGHWLVGILLPPRAQAKWYIWQRNFGGQILIAVVILGQVFPQYGLLRVLLGPVRRAFANLLLGIPYA